MSYKIDESKIFRLSAMLYENENYNVGKDNTLKKIIESIFVANENKPLEMIEVIKVCNEQYKLFVDEKEIHRIILNKYHEKFNLTRQGDGQQFTVNLSSSRYEYLKNKENTYNMIRYIDEFIRDKDFNDDVICEVKELIVKFLYQLFTSNLNCYDYFLNGKPSGLNYSIDYKRYSPDEVDIINSFLSYENENKDKAVFDIVNLSLDYCILTGDNNQIYIEGLNNKVFYLDTNIIYRALGINGDNRKILTIKFLEKCLNTGISIRLSKFTISEFKNSVKYYINRIKRNKVWNIDSEVYCKYSSGKDIINLYHEWRLGRKNPNLEHFEAYIMSLYEGFIKDYKIVEDYKVYFDENSSKFKEMIEDYSVSMSKYKVSESETACSVDAKNIILINEKRKLKNKNNTKFLETRYFMISTDQKLKEWNYRQIESEVPIILLPTQWLNITLRYGSRTKDDYKSFSNFIMLNKIRDDVDREKLITVLGGISELTTDIKYQSMFAEQLIEQKANNIIENDNVSEIYENTKIYVSENIGQKLKVKEEELKGSNEQYDALNKEMVSKVKCIEELTKKIFIDDEIKKVKNSTIRNLVLITIIISWIVLQFLFLEWKYNLPNKILTNISSSKLLNDGAKNFIYCANYGISALLCGKISVQLKKNMLKMIDLYKNKKENNTELKEITNIQ